MHFTQTWFGITEGEGISAETTHFAAQFSSLLASTYYATYSTAATLTLHALGRANNFPVRQRKAIHYRAHCAFVYSCSVCDGSLGTIRPRKIITICPSSLFSILFTNDMSELKAYYIYEARLMRQRHVANKISHTLTHILHTLACPVRQQGNRHNNICLQSEELHIECIMLNIIRDDDALRLGCFLGVFTLSQCILGVCRHFFWGNDLHPQSALHRRFRCGHNELLGSVSVWQGTSERAEQSVYVGRSTINLSTPISRQLYMDRRKRKKWSDGADMIRDDYLRFLAAMIMMMTR